MKRINLFLITSLLIISPLAAQANDCGNLNVSISNETGDTCQLLKSETLSGSIIAGSIPQILQNAQGSQTFTIQQSYTSGPSIRLEYRCENKQITFISKQGLCITYSAHILGKTENSTSNIKAIYTSKYGSWWNSTPGEIHWTLD